MAMQMDTLMAMLLAWHPLNKTGTFGSLLYVKQNGGSHENPYDYC